MAWPPIYAGGIPADQQAAMPLYKLGEAGDGGHFVSFAGKIFRYWTPTALGFGLPAANIPNGLGLVGIVSRVLDLRGCRNINLVLKRVLPGAGPGVTLLAGFIWIQFSDGAVASCPASSRQTMIWFNNPLDCNGDNGTYIYSLFCADCRQQSIAYTYANAFGVGFARIVVTGFVAGDNSFTCEMWGQG